MAGSVELEAPSLLPCEVLNAVRFTGAFSAEELRSAAEDLEAMGISFHPLEGRLATDAVDLALTMDLTIHDVSYVALARQSGPTSSPQMGRYCMRQRS